MRRTRRQAMKEAEEARIGNLSSQTAAEQPGPSVQKSSTPEAMPDTGRKKKLRPPRKKRKVKGKENTVTEIDEYERDVVCCQGSDAFKFIIGIVEKVQYLSRTSQRRKFLVQMNDFYLMRPDGNGNERDMLNHQKHFATCLWHIMLPVVKCDKNIYSDAAFKFFMAAVLGTGQQTHLHDEGGGSEKPFPLVQHILYFILKFHNDQRLNVRVRILELLKGILLHAENHPEQIAQVRQDLFKEVIQHRIRDKIAAVRTAAVHCLPYYKDNMTARQAIQFSSAYDPSPEARRSALSFLPQFPSIKASLYIARAFDTSESVRTEAYLQLSKLDFSRLVKKPERYKLIDWGLSPSSGKPREVVAKALLPHWLTECNNNLVTLFNRLGLVAKPTIARLIIDALYPEGSSKEYDDIDWTFLPEEGQKLIPLDELTVEKAQVWLLLCEKFRNTPFCATKLLPEPVDIMEYIGRFLAILRDQQKRGEDDFSQYICFFITLKLCNCLTFEEGVRREMVELLKKILLDPVIEDALIINTAIDLSGKLVEAEYMHDYLVGILKEFFDSSLLNEEEMYNSRRASNSDELEEVVEMEEVENQVHAMTILSSKSPNQLDRRRESSRVEEANDNIPPGSSMEQEHEYMGEADMSVSPIFTSPVREPRFQATSTPIKPKQVNMRDKLDELKSKLAETKLERHRFLNDIDKATIEAKYLECHEIKLKVDACVEKEKELQAQIEEVEQLDEADYPNPTDGSERQNQYSIIRGGDNTFMSDSLISRHLADSMAMINQAEGEQYNLMAHSILKALTILLRFLNWTRKITPYLRSLYEYEVIQCLEDEDARVRACTVYLYCLYGMSDRKVAKRSLLISLQALQFDVYDAQIAGFKSSVDLLLAYPLLFYRPTAAELQDEDSLKLPHPFDDPNGTNKELENGVITLLMKLGGETPGETELETRILGFCKLLLKGRVTNVNLVHEFLSIWANPKFGTSRACYQIGLFIRMYGIIAASNASIILDAFLLCVKEIAACQEMEEDSNGLAGADVMKLAEFVAVHTSSEALSRFDDGFVVHEGHVMDTLQYIKDNNGMRENQYLARSIKYFTVVKLKTAHNVKKLITEVLESDSGNISGTALVKNYLRIALKQLEKKFAIGLDSLDDEDEEEPEELQEEETQSSKFLHEVVPKRAANTMEVAARGHEGGSGDEENGKPGEV